ncbi:hypothetical protein KDN32_17385 [Nocardioides sp. J2M5]|uniref:hypothetical protein n=1 Tax=Nocardioides palaemonis TaxID=2829810 RepID=UPI001BA68693|nr:hypothetical protein [Nocardioides palaemonis]MBS2939518.1 hypothetical protein [Nocardioides palaemonis]
MTNDAASDNRLFVNQPSRWLLRSCAWALATVACIAFAGGVALSLARRADLAPAKTAEISDLAMSGGAWALLAGLPLLAIIQMLGRDEVPPAIEDDSL